MKTEMLAVRWSRLSALGLSWKGDVRMTVAGSEWVYPLMEDAIPAEAEFTTREPLP